MTNSIYTQAKEIQKLAGQMLCEETTRPYTDVEVWKELQEKLAKGIDVLLGQEGTTPQEEGEAALAILMGYTIAPRNGRNITLALERAVKVLPLLNDPMLKCRLAVFGYGECFDEELAETAHQLMEEQKQAGNEKAVCEMEDYLLCMRE